MGRILGVVYACGRGPTGRVWRVNHEAKLAWARNHWRGLGHRAIMSQMKRKELLWRSLHAVNAVGVWGAYARRESRKGTMERGSPPAYSYQIRKAKRVVYAWEEDWT